MTSAANPSSALPAAQLRAPSQKTASGRGPAPDKPILQPPPEDFDTAATTGGRHVPWLIAAIAALFGAITANYVALAFRQKLWLDDLYTLNLIQAHDLPHLWQAIALGIDGNPPAYLTFAWLLTHLLPQLPAEVSLRLANVALVAGALWALVAATRRFTSRLTACVALIIFVTCSVTTRSSALELRCYALYLCADAVSLLLLLRFLEQRRLAAWGLLTAALVVLTASHTFGLAYAATLAMGGALVALCRGERRLALALAASLMPASLAFAAWSPFLLAQSEVGRPYSWISPPEWKALVPLFAETVSALALLACSARLAHRPLRGLLATLDLRLQALLVIGAGELLFALAVWIASRSIYPVFMARYMAPEALVFYALIAWLLSLMLDRARADLRFRRAVPIALAFLAIFARLDARDVRAADIPCVVGETERFLEGENPKLPVVTESPHVFLPRRWYGHATYLFPLDWQVVENYPTKARNNAVDFHIMRRFAQWAGVSQILPTAEILKTYPDFLVLQEADRSWFAQLTETMPVDKQLIAQTAKCRLWAVHQRPR